MNQRVGPSHQAQAHVAVGCVWAAEPRRKKGGRTSLDERPRVPCCLRRPIATPARTGIRKQVAETAPAPRIRESEYALSMMTAETAPSKLPGACLRAVFSKSDSRGLRQSRPLAQQKRQVRRLDLAIAV